MPSASRCSRLPPRPATSTVRGSTTPRCRSSAPRRSGGPLPPPTRLAKRGARQITVDGDVLQADGGTRTAAITGGFVALAIACRRLARTAGIEYPIREEVAAVSVGMLGGEARLDLP